MRRSKKGFSIVELIIVIAVIAVLAAVLIPVFFSMVKNARISADNTTVTNLNKAVATKESIGSFQELTSAIEDVYGLAYLQSLAPVSAVYGNHFWFDNSLKKVILSTIEDLEDKGDEAVWFNCPNSNIVDGYTLLDAGGSDLADLLSGVSNICSKTELNSLANKALSMYNNGETYLENLIDYLSHTVIINSNGSFRFENLENVFNVYFPSDYVSLGTQILYTYDINTNTTNIHKTSLGYPLVGDGMYGAGIEIKKTMYFGTRTFLVEEDCNIVLICDVDSVEDLKTVFAAAATNAYVALASAPEKRYVIVGDVIQEAESGDVVADKLEYSVSEDVINYSFPYTEAVTYPIHVERSWLTGKTTSDTFIAIENSRVSIFIPKGVKVDSSDLTLTITPLEISESNFVVTGFATASIDVHVEGVSKSNQVPLIISLGAVLPKGLNRGAVKLYHIEDGLPQPMTMVNSFASETRHNMHTYDANTGEVTVALKSFSELLMQAGTENKWNGDIAEDFGGGEGTEESPYLISTVDQLAYLAQEVNKGKNYYGKYFRLEADLVINSWDLTEKDIVGMTYSKAQEYCAKDFKSSATNDPAFEQYNKAYKPWTPIGDGSNEFSGIFDGNNHTVSGLYKLHYTDPMDKNPMGLFGWVHDATIRNLIIADSFIYTYGGTVGLVTGYASGNTTIENVTVTDNFVTSYNYPLGGIVGYMWGSGVETGDKLILKDVTINSSNLIEALWETYDSQVGGLVGRASANTTVIFENCEVWPELSLYNDCCANYQWFAYRYSGMLIGYVAAGDRADYLTNNVNCTNVLVKYGEWTDQYYCELKSLGKGSYNGEHEWKYTRIGKDQVVRDEQGHVTGCDVSKTWHTSHELYPDDEDHCGTNITFNQLFGGGQGVYGETPDQFEALKSAAGMTSGVTVKRYTMPVGEEPETPDYSNSFELKFKNTDKYLYRVGNANDVSLSSLFEAVDGTNIDSTQINVTFENKQGTDATYTPNNTTWTSGTIRFSGAGVIMVELVYYGQVVETLNLEVIDAVNLTSIANVENLDAVLLNDCGMGETSYTVKNGHTLYGNGFTISSMNVGLGLNAGLMSAGYISLDNGNIENTNIVCALYPRGYLYSSSTSYGEAVQDDNNLNKLRSDKDGNGNFTKKRYNYQYSALTTTGKCSISNCYIEGARNNILIKAGSDGTTIYNTTLAYGSLANIHITDNEGTIVFKDLTTIQNVIKTNLPDSVLQDGNHNSDIDKTVFGLGILVGDNESSSYPTIRIEGNFTQYNWIKGGTTVSSAISNQIINSVFNGNNSFIKTIDGSKYVNLGIVYMTTKTPSIDDNDFIDRDSYDLGNVSLSFGSGKTYSFVGSADSSRLIAPEYQYSANNEAEKHVDKVKLVYVGSNDFTVNEEFDIQSSKLIPTIRAGIDAGETALLDVKDIISKRMGKTYSPTSYTVNGEAVDSSYIISSDGSGLFEIEARGNTSGYYDENGEFISDPQDYRLTFRFIVISNAIPDPVLIFNSNYDSYNNKFATSTSSEWTGVWNVLNDVELQYYSKSRGAVLTVPLSYFISGSNTKGSDHASWVGTYDDCTLTLTSTSKIHDGQSQYGYFIISNGDLYITNDKKVSTGTSDRKATIKYEIADCNMKTTSATKSRTVERTKAKAKSVSTGSNYILRLDPGLGSISQYSYGPNAKNTIITLKNTPSLDNHEFLGWYDAPVGGTRKDSNLSYVTTAGNVVLFAHWRELINYTVLFDADGGYMDSNSYSNYSGTECDLPGASRDGYWLVGWFDGDTNRGKAGDNYTIPERNVTLTAHWSPIYTVTYDMTNGGTVSPASSTYEGTAIMLPTPTPGSQPTFEGWFTAASGGTKTGIAGDSYTPSENVTLYAQWSNNIPVMYNENGGSCDTSRDTYDGMTPITLPHATRAGYQFNGWYTAASGGTKVGDAGATYTPDRAITLYARWTAYTVTYDANGGSVSPSSASGMVTLPTPTRTGYTFNGWYTATSGGTKIGNGGASYTPTEDITLYAQWTVNSYKVTITTSNSSTAVTVNGTTVSSGGSVAYNSVVKVVLSYTQSNSLTFTIKQGNTTVTRFSNEACTSTTTSIAAGTYYFKMPAGDVTINSSSTGSCLAPDTMILMADGTEKQVQYVIPGDELLVFNHETGEIETSFVLFNDTEEEQEFEIINLDFSNGKRVRVISEHGFFDLDLMKYVYIDGDNYEAFVGHRFYGIEGEYTLDRAFITYEAMAVYSPVTYSTLNYFTEGMLSMPGGITGLFNIFDYDNDLRYDQAAMNRDIETYGLFTAEEMEGIGVTEIMFNAYNGKYLKIALGKGILTEEHLMYMIERYGGFTE